MGAITLNNSTVLNRLGEREVISIIINDQHCLPLPPAGSALRWTLETKKFLLESVNDHQKRFFISPDDLSVDPGSVICFESKGNDIFVDHYPTGVEQQPGQPHERIQLVQSDGPDNVSGKDLVHLSNTALNVFQQLINLVDYDSTTRAQFPRAALHALIDEASLPADASGLKLGAAVGDSAAGDGAGSGSDKFDRLRRLLSTSTETAWNQVKMHRVPKPPIILVKPKEGDEGGQKYYEKYVRLMTAMVSLYQELLRVQKMEKEGRKQPYNASDPIQAAQAMKENADLLEQVVTTSLSGYYDSHSVSWFPYSKAISGNNIGSELATGIFQRFGLNDETLRDISDFLKQYFIAIKDIKTDATVTGQMISFPKLIHQVVRRNVGDDRNPVFVYQGKAILLSMHIDSMSYKQLVKTYIGNSGSQPFSLDINIGFMEVNINDALIDRNRENLEKVARLLGRNFNDFSQLPGISEEVQD